MFSSKKQSTSTVLNFHDVNNNIVGELRTKIGWGLWSKPSDPNCNRANSPPTAIHAAWSAHNIVLYRTSQTANGGGVGWAVWGAGCCSRGCGDAVWWHITARLVGTPTRHREGPLQSLHAGTHTQRCPSHFAVPEHARSTHTQTHTTDCKPEGPSAVFHSARLLRATECGWMGHGVLCGRRTVHWLRVVAVAPH